MREISLENRAFGPADKQRWLGKVVSPSHVGTVIDLEREDGPVLARDETGTPVFYACPLEGYDPDVVLSLLDNIKFETNRRMATGKKSQLIQIGFTPRQLFNGQACLPTKHYTGVMKHFGYYMSVYGEDQYRRVMPELYGAHAEQMRKLRNPEMRMAPGSLFTSAVINCNNDIEYHIDTGNTDPGTTLLCYFMRDVDGGHTVVPELDFAYKPRNNWMTIFDGFRYIHGVEPIRQVEEGGVRYSVVFYSKKGLFKCHTSMDEEVEAANQINGMQFLGRTDRVKEFELEVTRVREQLRNRYGV